MYHIPRGVIWLSSWTYSHVVDTFHNIFIYTKLIKLKVSINLHLYYMYMYMYMYMCAYVYVYSFTRDVGSGNRVYKVGLHVSVHIPDIQHAQAGGKARNLDQPKYRSKC